MKWLQESYLEPPRHNPRDFEGQSDIEIAREALLNIAPKYASNHADWVRVGYACKSVDEALLKDWIEWSRSGEGFAGEEDCVKKWESLRPSQLTIGTLIHLAKEGGWQPRQDRSSPTRQSKALSPQFTPLVDPKLRAKPEEYGAEIRKVYRLEAPITIRELIAADYRDDYLIEGCLVANQPCLNAGASKTLKTFNEVARCLSFISGEPFLGKFRVTQPCSVFFCTAESGKATIQRTFKALAHYMGIDLTLVPDSMLKIAWWVPRVSNIELMDYFSFEAEQSGCKVCIIDPTYMAIDDQQSSMVLNGQQLATLCNRVLDIGATPILVDHVKRSSTNASQFEPLELNDVSGAGKAEYFRQWQLISRRSKFEPCEIGEPHNHDLWLTFGGSAGHASIWGADVSELVSPNGDRQYEVHIRTRSEVLEERQESRHSEVKSKADQKAELTEEKLQCKSEILLNEIYKGDRFKSLSQNDIKASLGIKTHEAQRVIAILVNSNKLKLAPMSIVKHGKKYDGYVLFDSIRAGTWTG